MAIRQAVRAQKLAMRFLAFLAAGLALLATPVAAQAPSPRPRGSQSSKPPGGPQALYSGLARRTRLDHRVQHGLRDTQRREQRDRREVEDDDRRESQHHRHRAPAQLDVAAYAGRVMVSPNFFGVPSGAKEDFSVGLARMMLRRS